MGWSSRYYIPSFMEIGPPVPEKIFEGFLPYMGMAAILVMWPASCHQIFISLYLKGFIKNLFQIGTVASEKIQFEFLYVHNLGPRSRNDLDLQYSITFINSLRCLLLPTFRSLAATVSVKSTVFSSPEPKAHRWAYSIPMLRRPSYVVVVVRRRPQFQTSSSPKPLGRSKPNFIWSLLG